MNVLSPTDKVLVVDGGAFGHRFVELCEVHNIPHVRVVPQKGHSLSPSDLTSFAGQGFSALVVNIHETSTGVHHDPEMLGEFCRKNNMLFIVDAISSFLADKNNMVAATMDVIITGSQKVLACAPGVSIIVLGPKAIQRVEKSEVKTIYFDLKSALKNGERGQTPFTPAVGVLRQINARLRQINEQGGPETEIAKIKAQAEDFRTKIKGLPFEIVSHSMSNALTPLHPTTASAYEIFLKLKDEYGIWICPNGGDLKDTVFRVGHFGAQTTRENDILIDALKDLQTKNFI